MNTEIPYGYCQCGCGEKTNADTPTGIPKLFRWGHGRRGRLTAPVDARFWRKVDKSGGPDACWPWMGSLAKRGYGDFAIRKDGKPTKIGAHRAALVFSGVFLQAGACVLHRCDNPACCNPAHLFVGTQTENIADMVAKGRNFKGKAKTAAYILAGRCGETNPKAKLSNADVSDIRHRYKAGGWTYERLAAAFGVSASLVQNIVTNKRRIHG